MKVNFYNTKKLKYLNTLNSGRAKRNSRGNIIKAATFQSEKAGAGRIEPTKAWFTNTKTITQNELDECRNAIKTKNPYDVLLSVGSMPYTLINNDVKLKRKRDYSESFGSKAQRKRPRLQYNSLEEMVNMEKSPEVEKSELAADVNEIKHVKGQSHRIWNELYKVLDSSDVVVHVLDARDPLGTKCEQIEEFIKTKGQHKHLIYVLNKVDLVPKNVTAGWLRELSKEHPCIACHMNGLNNNYGKNSLMNVLRQLKTLYKKETLSVGFVGYPNTGKSSIINGLRNKEVCKTAPVPGETRCWQYIALMKDLYLIDSPGVVPVRDYEQAVLRGAIRIENVEGPEEYLEKVIEKTGKDAIEKTYGIEFCGVEGLIEAVGKRYGKMKKGGEINVDIVAKMILHDFVRGKIPYYVAIKE